LWLAQADLLANKPDFARQHHPSELLPTQRRVVGIGQRPGIGFGVAVLFETIAFLFIKSERSATLTDGKVFAHGFYAFFVQRKALDLVPTIGLKEPPPMSDWAIELNSFSFSVYYF